MICEEHLLKMLHASHVSEKSSMMMKNGNTVALKVSKNATKSKIKSAVKKLFSVEVQTITTLVVKGKTKGHGQHVGRNKNWKKAYVTLKKGQNLNFISE